MIRQTKLALNSITDVAENNNLNNLKDYRDFSKESECYWSKRGSSKRVEKYK